MRTKVVGNLGMLPEGGFGLRSVVWWGLLGFMAIEGMAFVLGAGVYLYLRQQSQTWPPPSVFPPDLLWGTLTTVFLVASEALNRWLAHKSRGENDHIIRIGVTAMAVAGLLLIALRFMEFPHLNVRWDQNAYGSAVWLLMVMHTLHLITDVADTIIFDIWLFTHDVTHEQFSEVYDNCGYWSFVVVSWLPIYALVYWGPRWL